MAYNDKGSGTGVHDLAANTVNLIDGVRKDAGNVGKSSTFTAKLSAGELSAFNAATPNRVAVKHAHSQENPEKSWGLNTLQGSSWPSTCSTRSSARSPRMECITCA